jgi:DNA polymerase-1
VIRKEQPSHLAVVFDPPGPGFRNEMYEAYKAQRPPMPEELRQSIPYIRKLIQALNIEQIEVPRYEADDVIGTIATKVSDNNFTDDFTNDTNNKVKTFIFSSDKDLQQLINDSVVMIRPGKSFEQVTEYDINAVKEKIGISY